MRITKDHNYYAMKIAIAIADFEKRVALDPDYASEWRRSRAYRYWAICVIRKYRKCACCDNPETLHAHHIKDAANHDALKFAIENGVALCNECHKYIHNAIAGGYGNGCSESELSVLMELRYHRRILRKKLDRVKKERLEA